MRKVNVNDSNKINIVIRDTIFITINDLDDVKIIKKEIRENPGNYERALDGWYNSTQDKFKDYCIVNDIDYSVITKNKVILIINKNNIEYEIKDQFNIQYKNNIVTDKTPTDETYLLLLKYIKEMKGISPY